MTCGTSSGSKYSKIFSRFLPLAAFVLLTACNVVTSDQSPGAIKPDKPEPEVPVNHAPEAIAQIVNASYNTAAAITLTGTDADGHSLTYTVVADPAHGTLSGTAPNLSYAPTTGYLGNDSFSFKVNDGAADSAPATVTITVAVPPIYFCDQGSGLWSDPANWYNDSGCSSGFEASRIPVDGDSVYIQSGVFYDQVPSISLARFDGECQQDGSGYYTSQITIEAGGVLNARGYCNWGGTTHLTATVNFYDSSVNYGSFSGNAMFNDSSDNMGTVSGTLSWGAGNPNKPVAANHVMYFCDQGNYQWADRASWFANVGCSTKANRTPDNGDSIYIQSGTYYDAPPSITVPLFDGNCGSDASQITIEAGGVLNARGFCNWNGTTHLTATVNFYDSSVNTGSISGNATFNDSSVNNGSIGLNATFSNSSASLTDIAGDAVFSDTSMNFGNIGRMS